MTYFQNWTHNDGTKDKNWTHYDGTKKKTWTHSDGARTNGNPHSTYYKTWGKLFYISGIAIIGTGALLLILFGVLRVKPYLHAMRHVDGFLPGTCNVSSSNYTGKWWSCRRGKSEVSRYPCLEIRVQYFGFNGANSSYTHLNVTDTWELYESEFQLINTPGCAYKPPCLDVSRNVANVARYKQQYGQPGKRYQCYQSPRKVSEIIRTKQARTEYVIHLLLWPSVQILFGVVLIIIGLIKFGCSKEVWRDPAK